MSERIYVGTKPLERDALGEKIRSRIIEDLKIGTIDGIRTVTVYAINASMNSSELVRIAEGPLTDPVVQSYTINETLYNEFDWMVEVGYLPGVTDNVGRTAREAIEIMFNNNLPEDFSVHTATQYFFEGMVSRKHIESIAEGLLANNLIQSINIYSKEEWLAVHQKDFGVPVVTGKVDVELYHEIDLNIDDEDLMKISRDYTLALSLDEMKAIQSYYSQKDIIEDRIANGLPKLPTNVELEVLAQTWSEHCKHKIFNADITYYDENGNVQKVSNLFKSYIQETTRVIREQKGEDDICLSVFKDNAGVIKFNEDSAVVFKCETHNSPSALDPYGGALTGIVGVNRDPFGTGLGCRLIANTDVFCFADPATDRELPPRILHPKRIMDGVREGVEHGGNKSGIPTVNGSMVFDDRFLGKPLVYCGTLGVMPMEINGRKGYEKEVLKGDHIIMTGGRIGKDGIHGATFSSEPLHEGSPATAVQIGDPITQKRMTDFLIRARDRNLYSSITDNGAGGLSSSIGEMAEDTNGAVVHLDRAPLKYHGLEPWEIFVSEAQERMTVAVPPENVDEFMALAKEWNCEATDLGEFTTSGYLELFYDSKIVARIPMDFLHDGLPQMQLTARWKVLSKEDDSPINSSDLKKDTLNLLKRLNICSKEFAVRQYDHEVQGGSVVKPLCGARNDGPSDAGVIRPLLDSFEGVVVSHGIVPRYSDIDTYAMTQCSVDEAVRNAVCSGADPEHLAGLDNFCWCDPVASDSNKDGEYKLAQLVRANQALYDICVAYGVPLISGKDSMKNDYHIGDTRISIPPTLLFSAVSKIHDVNNAVTMDFKNAGNSIYIIGKTYREMGASEYALMNNIESFSVPRVHDPKVSFETYKALHSAIKSNLVRTAHDLSDGGFAIALVEMCFAGDLGATVDLSALPRENGMTDSEIMFSESPSRIIVEVKKENENKFEALFKNLPYAKIGEVQRGDIVRVLSENKEILNLSTVDARDAWKSTLDY